MRVTFITRQRSISDSTALPIAAGYDAAFLERQGHHTRRLSIPVDKVPAFDFRGLHYTSDLVVIEGASWIPIVKLQAILEMGVQVLVRVHAAPEFLYAESPHACAASYIRQCVRAGIDIGVVSPELTKCLQRMLGEAVTALPIVYPPAPPPPHVDLRTQEHISVGAFGATRPLKNQIAQLLALGEAKANWFRQHRFSYHINSDRAEDFNAADILRTLEVLAEMLGIQLVKHKWCDQTAFKAEVIPKMSMGIFVSLAESFCLTAADFVQAGKPVVLGKHIPWALAGCGSTVPEMAEAIRLCIMEPTQMQDDWASLTMAGVDAKEQWQTLLSKVKSNVLTN